MAQLVVRKIENGVKERLQRRARRNGRSMEEEARDILRNAVQEDCPHGLGAEISVCFQGGIDFDIPSYADMRSSPHDLTNDYSGYERVFGSDECCTRSQCRRLA